MADKKGNDMIIGKKTLRSWSFFSGIWGLLSGFQTFMPGESFFVMFLMAASGLYGVLNARA